MSRRAAKAVAAGSVIAAATLVHRAKRGTVVRQVATLCAIAVAAFTRAFPRTSTRLLWRPLLLALLARVAVLPLARIFIDRFLVESLELRSAKDTVAGRLVLCCDAFKKGYNPTPWLLGDLLQSASAELERKETSGKRAAKPAYRREVIHLPERSRPRGATCCPRRIPSGVVSVDWLGSPSSIAEASAVVFLVAGLTGSSSSPYIQRAAKHLVATWPGVLVGCYNPRGRGGNELVTPFLYSAGYTEDLKSVLRARRENSGTVPFFLIGYSLGSNVCAKLVGEQEAAPSRLVDAAVLCACPIDLPSQKLAMRSTMEGSLWDKVLVGFCQKLLNELPSLREKAKANNIAAQGGKGGGGGGGGRGREGGDGDGEGDDRKAMPQSMTELDHDYVAPMFGYASAAEYYRNASSGNHLRRIAVPSLFLHARNDPISSPGALPEPGFDCFACNPFLAHVVTREGAHSMDWPEGERMQRSWSAEIAGQFLSAVARERRQAAKTSMGEGARDVDDAEQGEEKQRRRERGEFLPISSPLVGAGGSLSPGRVLREDFGEDDIHLRRLRSPQQLLF